MCLLSATTRLSSHISNFVLSKQKLVILTDMQDPNLTTTCWYFFINTLTGHQKSVQGCFPFLESNLGLWDENRCFTNGLLKCLVPRATKEFTWSYMYKSIHISPPFQPYRHSNNYYRRVIQMTRLQTTWGSTPPQFFVSLLPLFLHTPLVVSLPVSLSFIHHRSALTANLLTILFLDSKTTKVTAITLMPYAVRGTVK